MKTYASQCQKSIWTHIHRQQQAHVFQPICAVVRFWSDTKPLLTNNRFSTDKVSSTWKSFGEALKRRAKDIYIVIGLLRIFNAFKCKCSIITIHSITRGDCVQRHPLQIFSWHFQFSEQTARKERWGFLVAGRLLLKITFCTRSVKRTGRPFKTTAFYLRQKTFTENTRRKWLVIGQVMENKLRPDLPPSHDANGHQSVKDDSLQKNHSQNSDDHRARPQVKIWRKSTRMNWKIDNLSKLHLILCEQ